MADYKTQLIEKFNKRDVRVGIIGLGYVGLPLAVVFGEAGYKITGIDLDPSKIDAINRGQSYIEDVSTSNVAALVERGLLTATTDFSALL
jgi:UDP-N-acetyl-D-glucosamine dehydrogenase